MNFTSAHQGRPDASQEQSGIRARIKKWFNRPQNEPSPITLLNLVKTELSVKYRSINKDALEEHQKGIYAGLKEKLEKLKPPTEANAVEADQRWEEIYEVESLLALLYSGEQLRQEIVAARQELTDLNKIEAHAFRPDCEEVAKQPVDNQNSRSVDDKLRTCLLRLMEAIHWNKNQQYLLREMHAQATHRILWCIMLSSLLVILPYILFDYRSWLLPNIPLWAAVTSGLFGAFFFRLNDIRNISTATTVDQADLQRKLSYTILRALVGVCGALIVYFFLRSGIFGGKLFGGGDPIPDFSKFSIELLPSGDVSMKFAVPSPQLAVLTFLCFLAGYSEKLVPNIISGVEGQPDKFHGPIRPQV